MTNDEIKESIDAYNAQLTLINQTMAKIRKHCKHKETELKSISKGVMDLKKVCKYCGAQQGYPTQEELKNAGYTQT